MQPLMTDDIVKQLSIGAILHNEEQFTLSLNYFVELNDIRVSQFLEYFDFPGYPLDVLLVLDARLLQDFDCHLLPSQDMSGQFDLPEGTFTK